MNLKNFLMGTGNRPFHAKATQVQAQASDLPH
jgi:hypothetical protein